MKHESRRRARCRQCKELAPVVRNTHGQQEFDYHTQAHPLDGTIPCPGIGDAVAARRNRRKKES